MVLLLFIVISGARGWWVYGRAHDAIVNAKDRECEMWKQSSFRATERLEDAAREAREL